MRHLSDHFVFFIVLGLFTCKIFYAAAYDGLEDVQLPVQAGDSYARLGTLSSCGRCDTTDPLRRL
jgi:hypothetical protein